jgi:hypothetical protein
VFETSVDRERDAWTIVGADIRARNDVRTRNQESGTMSEYVRYVGLAVTVMLTITFIGSAITSLVRGRVKIEPNQPWVVFDEHPVKFAACVL